MVLPPPKKATFSVTMRIVIDERRDGVLLAYLTNPTGSGAPMVLARAIEALGQIQNALKNGKFSLHAVGTEAEAIEVQV
jgi:hypothetical protein